MSDCEAVDRHTETAVKLLEFGTGGPSLWAPDELGAILQHQLAGKGAGKAGKGDAPLSLTESRFAGNEAASTIPHQGANKEVRPLFLA
jgi:hypothetical protein